MIRKTAKICAIVVGALLLLSVAAYIALGFYYNPFYTYGTWINGIYCTGLDAATVNQKLIDSEQDFVLTIQEADGKKEQIEGKSIGYSLDYSEALFGIKKRQNPFNWGYYVFYPLQEKITPKVSYDDNLLQEQIEQLQCYHLEEQNQKLTPQIKKKGSLYQLIDERTEIIDQDKTIKIIRDAVLSGKRVVSLTDSNCYIPFEMSEQDKRIYELWKQIDRIQNSKIVYQDAALELTLDGTEAIKWLQMDEQGDFILDHGSPVLDREQIEKYTEKIAAKFDSNGNVRTWIRNDGKVVTIHSKGKGYRVDCEAEAAEILSTITTGNKRTRLPIYAVKGEPREAIDMGDTYIEIDMTAQKLYYYKNKQQVFESDIVTGNVSRRHSTPEAVCEIYYMQKNRTLHGADYESFVYYWMAVKGHIGIHDATWRDEFGGDIYKTAGSHGCINIPKKKAAELYQIVEVGTPVIMYYLDDESE